MEINSIFKKAFFAMTIICSVSAFGQQTMQEKIQTKWNLSKFEFENPSPNSAEVQNQLGNIIIIFEKDNMVVSKKIGGCEQFIKLVHYNLNGDYITIGDDKAEILLLDEQQLKIKVKGQGILHFTKN
jgi:hypothetical protein